MNQDAAALHASVVDQLEQHEPELAAAIKRATVEVGVPVPLDSGNLPDSSLITVRVRLAASDERFNTAADRQSLAEIFRGLGAEDVTYVVELE